VHSHGGGPRWATRLDLRFEAGHCWRGNRYANLKFAGPGVGPKCDLVHAKQKALTLKITGTVKFYNSAKGFGFIAPADGSKDVFVHASALELAGIHSINEGDKVSFVLEDDRKGRGKQAGQIEKA